MNLARSCFLAFAASVAAHAADLTVWPEFLRVDPAGEVLASDRTSGAVPAREFRLRAARGGYVSCQLAAVVPEGGEYTLELAGFPAGTGIAADLYREWFHRAAATGQYSPDALVPVRTPYRSSMPEPDNRVPNQKAQLFWVDVWVPKDVQPGVYSTTATLRVRGNTAKVPIQVEVIGAILPDEDVVLIDHNSYGTSWLAEQYPGTSNNGVFDLIHAYHRLMYEHRGVFHQLGYGHAGKVGPEFAPVLEGSGKTRRVTDWSTYDRHYGPLLDGSAFANTRRGARPIPFVYLPVNPEWPASYLWWGEPGYEREFVQVLSEMERHFREKNWTRTNFELFFNHKKRYKGFEWDGDEARFPRDYEYMREYARLLKAAVPAGSPVKFAFRADVSWTMERQFRDLAGVVNFWVVGSGMFAWYRDAPKLLKDRGDIVWIYGGTPPATEPSSHITLDPLRTWMWGVDGFVRWQTTSPGKDPWFAFEGGGEALMYPGARFGIPGPVPTIRLKIQRNAVQDLTLLHQFRDRVPVETLRAEVARRFNATTLDEWWTPRPAWADTDPLEWNNAMIGEATAVGPKFAKLDAAAWQRVRDYVMEVVLKEAR